ncbi:hypothetical protein [Streptomyces roseus]|uniref:Uncharacterized protein n=1 Tax=Streptomyces roseus TaxID=66430 RepID=A0A0J6XPH2_9ACTN|nr:hypothetical protein [Streptomyces roseus]KMO98000.1 hypothetical protein ACS04_09900 [Streptomyces roseus]
MTENKALKKAIRKHMAETGEPFNTARRSVLASHQEPRDGSIGHAAARAYNPLGSVASRSYRPLGSIDVAKLIMPRYDVAKFIAPRYDVAKLIRPNYDMAKFIGMSRTPVGRDIST